MSSSPNNAAMCCCNALKDHSTPNHRKVQPRPTKIGGRRIRVDVQRLEGFMETGCGSRLRKGGKAGVPERRCRQGVAEKGEREEAVCMW